MTRSSQAIVNTAQSGCTGRHRPSACAYRIEVVPVPLWQTGNVETTQVYVHADLRLKEKARARLTTPVDHPGRYRQDDTLLAF